MTKALGAYNLISLCQKDPLKAVIAFSSISGRFGNPAQLDYCSANSFLNYWIKMLFTHKPEINAISFAWAGWKDIGIAWRNAIVRETAQEMGLYFIPPKLGVQAFIDNLSHITKDSEIVLHCGLGDFLEPGISVTPMENISLLDRVLKKHGKVVKGYKVLSTQRDAFMDQHRLGITPILPGAGSMEILTAFYTANEGRKDQYCLQNINFHNPVKLFHEKPREIYVEGEKIDDNIWKASLKYQFMSRKSFNAQIITNSEATISNILPDCSNIKPDQWDYGKLEHQFTNVQEYISQLSETMGLENTINLGPLYQSFPKKNTLDIYSNGITYPVLFPLEQIREPKYPLHKMHINPCSVDSIFQTAAIFCIIQKKQTYLPWEVEEYSVVKVPREENSFVVYCKVTHEEKDKIIFDGALINSRKELYYYAKGLTMHLIQT